VTIFSWKLQNVYILAPSKKMMNKHESERAEELLEIMMKEVKPRQEALSSHGYIFIFMYNCNKHRMRIQRKELNTCHKI
jgi:hypothetical protein